MAEKKGAVMDQKQLEEDLAFISKLNIDELKYEISDELGEMSEQAGMLLDEAERKIDVVPPKIEVRLSPDKLQAYLKVVSPGKPIPITEDDLRKSLEQKGVTSGILEKRIEEILVEKLIGQEVIIARGKAPENGRDGYIKPLQDLKKKSPEDCVDSRGRVDFKQMRVSNIVEVGEVIAEKVPATKGRQGFDVTGKVLSPRSGKDVDFRLTPNIGVSPENEFQLVALKNGTLKKNFTIEEINFINSDVDYSTGNINYPQSLVITGDVKSGFAVHCGENVEVRGCVEDAEVIADGDVIVKQGFLGDSKGLIKGKNVTIGHVKQQSVVASEDIILGGEAIRSSLRAGGFIRMLGVRGIVLGGELIAEKGIEVMNAGNVRNIKTRLRVGYNKEIENLEGRIGKLVQSKAKIETVLRIFKAAGKVKELSPEKKSTMNRLVETERKILEEMEKLERTKLDTVEALLAREKPYIKVVQGIFPNVTVCIGHLKKLITQEMRNKRFCYHKNSIFIGI
ncbi:MAG: DUF342 domain-containing protein [Candidatus Glassbacteria bacterium]|nr:DUF342 domain-containing protein [Candidatus Glassbacteria bacterium]